MRRGLGSDQSAKGRLLLPNQGTYHREGTALSGGGASNKNIEYHVYYT